MRNRSKKSKQLKIKKESLNIADQLAIDLEKTINVPNAPLLTTVKKVLSLLKNTISKSKEKDRLILQPNILKKFILSIRAELFHAEKEGLHSKDILELGSLTDEMLNLLDEKFLKLIESNQSVNNFFGLSGYEIYRFLSIIALKKSMDELNNKKSGTVFLKESHCFNAIFLEKLEQAILSEGGPADAAEGSKKRLMRNMAQLEFYSLEAYLFALENKQSLADEALIQVASAYQNVDKEALMHKEQILFFIRATYIALLEQTSKQPNAADVFVYAKQLDNYLDDQSKFYKGILLDRHRTETQGFTVKELVTLIKEINELKQIPEYWCRVGKKYLFNANINQLADLNFENDPFEIYHDEETFKLSLAFPENIYNTYMLFFIKALEKAEITFTDDDSEIVISDFDQVDINRLRNIFIEFHRRKSTPSNQAEIADIKSLAISTSDLSEIQKFNEPDIAACPEIISYERKNIAPTKYLTASDSKSSVSEKSKDIVRFANGLTNVSAEVQEFQFKNLQHSESADKKKVTHRYLFVNDAFFSGLESNVKQTLKSIWARGCAIGNSKGRKGIIKLSKDARLKVKDNTYILKLKDASKDYRFFAKINDKQFDKDGKKFVLYEVDHWQAKHKN